MIRELEKCDYGTNPKVLLLGNGINRAFDNYSWEKLLRELSDDT